MLIIKISQFLSTDDEIHAFIFGLCEAVAIIPSREEMPACYKAMIAMEYHYYSFGRALGTVVVFLAIAVIVRSLIGG